jgi:hypothetical protein
VYVENVRAFVRQLLATAQRREKEDLVRYRLCEWRRPGWTYHAKGVWVEPPPSLPQLKGKRDGEPIIATIIGSSNYGSFFKSFLIRN